MQGAANADLLQEIRATLRCLPGRCVPWKKAQAHLKRPPNTVHEVLNEEMDGISKLAHDDNSLQAMTCAQSFGSVNVELTVNNCLITGLAGKYLQQAYHGSQMHKELCKKHGWDAGQLD